MRVPVDPTYTIVDCPLDLSHERRRFPPSLCSGRDLHPPDCRRRRRQVSQNNADDIRSHPFLDRKATSCPPSSPEHQVISAGSWSINSSPPGQIVATGREVDQLTDLAQKGVWVRRADFADPITLGVAFAGADVILRSRRRRSGSVSITPATPSTLRLEGACRGSYTPASSTPRPHK